MRGTLLALAIAALVTSGRAAFAADELIDDPELAAKTGEKPRNKPAKPGKKKKRPEPAQVTLEEEVELAEEPEEAPASATGERGTAVGAAEGEQVIADPELAGATQNDGSFGDLNGPREPRWGVSFHTRWGYATQQGGRERQDIVEGTTIGIFEVEQRRSDELLYSVGLRFRHAFAKPREGTPGYDLDVAPVSAFADLTPTPGFHVRAGYQVINMGRFDSFTQTNFLAVADLRSGPVTMPEAANIAQPAIRIDVDAIEGLTIQAFYIPFFQPHLYPVYGSNYAAIDRIAALSDDPNARNLREQLDQAVVRSKLSRATTNFAQAFAPAPDFLRPQGALRITHTGPSGELAITVGTAIDRLPSSFQVVPRTDANNQLLFPEIRVNHDRFWVASVDGALDVGPFQLGAEAAYVKDRTLTAIGTLNDLPGDGEVRYPTITGKADLVHGGLRAELVEVDGWSGAIETFVIVATRGPDETVPQYPNEPGRSWLREPRWFGMENGRLQRGIAGGVQFAPEASGVRLELGGVAFTGPSYLIAPRVEWEALTRFYLELGAVFVGGPRPGGPGSPNVSIAGLFSDIDQVYTGVRWLP